MRALASALLAAALAWLGALAAEGGGKASGEAVFVQRGEASHYADELRGRRTASGEPFRQDGLTAASPDLPLGARIVVIHEETGRSVRVRVNDRGPHVAGRIVDLSRRAADALGIGEAGIAPVRIEARPSEQPNAALERAIARLAREQAASRPPPPAEKPPPPECQG